VRARRRRGSREAISEIVIIVVLFLESAGFVTGEILHVDGDRSAGH
jgi:hypothetical protein